MTQQTTNKHQNAPFYGLFVSSTLYQNDSHDFLKNGESLENSPPHFTTHPLSTIPHKIAPNRLSIASPLLDTYVHPCYAYTHDESSNIHAITHPPFHRRAHRLRRLRSYHQRFRRCSPHQRSTLHRPQPHHPEDNMSGWRRKPNYIVSQHNRHKGEKS